MPRFHHRSRFQRQRISRWHRSRWTEESVTFNKTEPVFKQVELVAHELSGYSRVSNSLLEDRTIGLEQLLITLFGRAIAWHEDHAFLRGDYVNKPHGLFNSMRLEVLQVLLKMQQKC